MKSIIKKIIFGLFLVLAIFIIVIYWHNLATERECGYNPLKLLKARTNELWCECNETSLYYGGFSCMNCSRFCEKYNLIKIKE